MAGTTPTDQRVEDYLATIENDQRRTDASTLIEIMSDITGEPPAMWGSSMIGFGTYHYRYASGHEGDSALASFAPRKQQLVLYLAGGFEDEHAAQMAKLGPHKTGKGCLYLKRLSEVDLDVLRTLIEQSVQVRRGLENENANP